MKTTAHFYHDGCNLCLSMAAIFATALNPEMYEVELIDLSRTPDRAAEAEKAGVNVLPSLVIAGSVLAVNPHSDLHH